MVEAPRMTRTTIDIDEQLLEHAMRVTGARTKTEVVDLALHELIRTRERTALLRELGSFDLDLDLERLRQLRGAE
jgi:Arc/MetJ family transcription regulator